MKQESIHERLHTVDREPHARDQQEREEEKGVKLLEKVDARKCSALVYMLDQSGQRKVPKLRLNWNGSNETQYSRNEIISQFRG